jgi:hypothetical protein
MVMGNREKREQKKTERIAAAERREIELRERRRSEIRAQRCPRCSADCIARLLYGLPDRSPDLQEEVDLGLVVLAGSAFCSTDPQWHCRNCHHEWGTLGELFVRLTR